MNERITFLRALEPRNAGLASYQAILETAAGLFQQFPADAITLRDILSVSGVSNQTLYNYFPAGRDDVAIILWDRFRRAVATDFTRTCEGLDWSCRTETPEVTQALGASLARAAFGPLAETYPVQSALFHYLRKHRLGATTGPFLELEEALGREILLRYGGRFSKRKLPLLVRLCAYSVLNTAEMGLAHPEFPLDALESQARKLVRTLLTSGVKGDGQASGSHGFPAYVPPPDAIVGAAISPAKRQTILARMFKRRSR
jgi:AcrR family transcriptional regulator